uniref:uncharacterized protein LOC104265449 n=1 Tax=Ciona intestinalis TaxID=7719 RepID=UPI000EF54311|nr:uncharacterized protein LOC104265449 [Ciona intestinalis]|eukprot:XP_026695212.1 uncharacterized protein LOC104265449 [Ciona intestinalis]
MKNYIHYCIIVLTAAGDIIKLLAPGNTATRALGISNLKISTTISTTGVYYCGWRYGGEFDVNSFYSFVGCRNYTGVNETIICVNNAGIVTSQLTLLQPQYKDLNINMQCSPSPSDSVNIVLKACPTGIISPGVILSKQSTSPCGYGCTARFSCAAGYTGNTVDATCNEQATWSPAPNCLLVYPYLTINLPTTNNKTTRALGISNLKVSTTISTTGVSRCGWRYGGEFDGGSFYISAFVRCYNYTGVNETITCVNNAGTVTSQLTLLQPQYKDLNIKMQCSPSPSYLVNIVLKACPTGVISPGVILSKQSTSPCGYGCTARFSCAAGYTGNTVDATCNEKATWSPAPNCLLVYPYLTINLPTTNNKTTRALGISNLKILTTISTNDVSICGWRYGGEFDGGLFHSGFGCSNYTGVNETITCVNNADKVTSQLTFLQPQYKDLNINMQCSPSPSYSVNIVLKACSSPTPNNVPVNPSSGGYNTQANFQCSHGSTLFNINGATENTATKCLATAEWENEKIVQCWAEPTAVLSGAIIYKVGERATFQCTTSNVVPAVYKVEIYFNGIKQVTGNTWTSNPLDISNEGDIVECRAINNYTAKPEYANLGRTNKTISIIYPPQKFKVTNAMNNVCLWEIGTTQYCNVTFKLKPSFYTTNLTRKGKLVTSDLFEMQRMNETQSFVYMKNEVNYNL